MYNLRLKLWNENHTGSFLQGSGVSAWDFGDSGSSNFKPLFHDKEADRPTPFPFPFFSWPFIGYGGHVQNSV